MSGLELLCSSAAKETLNRAGHGLLGWIATDKMNTADTEMCSAAARKMLNRAGPGLFCLARAGKC